MRNDKSNGNRLMHKVTNNAIHRVWFEQSRKHIKKSRWDSILRTGHAH